MKAEGQGQKLPSLPVSRGHTPGGEGPAAAHPLCLLLVLVSSHVDSQPHTWCTGDFPQRTALRIPVFMFCWRLLHPAQSKISPSGITLDLDHRIFQAFKTDDLSQEIPLSLPLAW